MPPLRTALRRLVSGALLFTAALLPASADAQARTYRYNGNVTFGGFDVPAQILLGGDAANVQALQPSGTVTGYRNTGLSGGVFVFGTTPFGTFENITLTNTFVPVAGTFPLPGLFATNALGFVEFYLTGAGLSAVNLSTPSTLVAVELFTQDGVKTGQGTFEVLDGNAVPPAPGGPPSSTVPEPGTWALLGTGLAALGAAGARPKRAAA